MGVYNQIRIIESKQVKANQMVDPATVPVPAEAAEPVRASPLPPVLSALLTYDTCVMPEV